MLAFTLILIAATAIATGTIIYNTTNNNARQIILALEIFISRNGRTSTSEVLKFKNQNEFQDFINVETERAAGLPNDPSNVHSLRNIYAVTASEELIREMKRNLVSYIDVEKYKNNPPKGVTFYTIK